MVKICVVLLLVARIIRSQLSDELNEENSCDRKVTCSECIQTKNCAWCMAPSMGGNARCHDPSMDSRYCEEEHFWHPDNEQRVLSMRELSRPGSAEAIDENQQSPVQISPQHFALKLRISEWKSYFE